MNDNIDTMINYRKQRIIILKNMHNEFFESISEFNDYVKAQEFVKEINESPMDTGPLKASNLGKGRTRKVEHEIIYDVYENDNISQAIAEHEINIKELVQAKIKGFISVSKYKTLIMYSNKIERIDKIRLERKKDAERKLI